MAKANDIDFAEMDIDEIDELEKKLAELKQRKMKEAQNEGDICWAALGEPLTK